MGTIIITSELKKLGSGAHFYINAAFLEKMNLEIGQRYTLEIHAEDDS